MGALLILVIPLYLISLAAVCRAGLAPTLPWSFPILGPLCFLPLAAALVTLGQWAPRRLAPGSSRRVVAEVLLGLLAVVCYKLTLRGGVLLLLGLAMLWDPQRVWRNDWRKLAWAMLVLGLELAVVWNLNYLAGKANLGHVHDEQLMRLDVKLFGWLLPGPVQRAGLYPLCHCRAVFHLFENAYWMLFPEIFAVLLVLARSSAKDLRQFLVALFLCYLLGLLVFVCYPVIGPYHWAPESLDPAYKGSMTQTLMQSLVEEYRAVAQGRSVNGIGYFVGLPSLHVAVALLMQAFLHRAQCLFWFFLPVNVLLIAATVILGYHYVLDVPAGIALAAVAIGVANLDGQWRGTHQGVNHIPGRLGQLSGG
jgi:membrane-associated phospholipid phosphatase